MASNNSMEYKSHVNIVFEPAYTTTSSPSSTQAHNYTDYAEGIVASALNTYYLWVLFFLGLLLNMAAILTISRLKPFTTSSLFVILLAIFDTLALLAKLAYLKLTQYDITLGDVGCKILCFVGSFLDQFSIWILILLTTERFVAVWLPLKVSSWFTMSRACLSVLITAICFLFINSHMLLLLKEVELPKPYGLDCRFDQRHSFFMDYIWFWIESCLTGILPCIILIVLNSLIVYRMRRSMEKQKALLSGTESPQTVSHRTHITVMLVTVSVSFVVLMLPLAIFNIVRSSWKPASAYEKAQFFLTGELTHLLADCNHGLNFLFYFLSSKRFRVVFYRIIKCRCQEPRPSIFSGVSKISYCRGAASVNKTCLNHATHLKGETV